MKIRIPSFIKLRPILVGVAIFSLMWMVMKEMIFRYEYYNRINGYYGSHVTPGLYYGDIANSIPLVIASIIILVNRVWSQTIALILSGFLFFEQLYYFLWTSYDTWEIRRNALRFSYEHFAILWRGSGDGEFLQILLAGVIFSCSLASLISLICSHKKPTKPNHSLNRSAS
ncbi:MAG TPA: hypothetical protein VGX92_10615 [Pyrinomonadaceae bacterium]|jgi:hypothetical protein|nr:hypothetical protein [Pyrinomonadaceae bacterium]